MVQYVKRNRLSPQISKCRPTAEKNVMRWFQSSRKKYLKILLSENLSWLSYEVFSAPSPEVRGKRLNGHEPTCHRHSVMELVFQGEMPLQCSRLLSHCVTPQNLQLSAHYSFSFVRPLEIEHTHAFFPTVLASIRVSFTWRTSQS